MPRPDLEYWHRRSSAVAILDHLRWSMAWIWAHARGPALGMIGVHLLLGIQPALFIYVLKSLVDTVIGVAGRGGSGFGRVLPWLLAYGLTLLLTNEILWKVRDTLHLRLEQRLAHVLGRRYLRKASQLPLLLFEVSHWYDRLERARDPGQKVDRLFRNAMHLFESALKAASVAAMFAPVSPWITLALLAVLVPQVRMEVAQSRMFMGFTYGMTEEERRARYVDRILTGRAEQKEMRAFALHGTLVERWRVLRAALRERILAQKRRQVRGSLAINGVRIAVSGGAAVALALLLARRVLTPGRFVALFQGIGEMLRAGFGVGYAARELQALSIEVGYVREFLDLPEEDGAAAPHALRDHAFPRPVRHGFSVEDVCFAYPPVERDDAAHGDADQGAASGKSQARPVLRGVSLRLVPGERVALVGENGSGKSTLARLLLGLHSPDSGCIAVDGVGYDQIRPESLASAVSAAFQDYYNFELTLGQSIGLGAVPSAPGAVPSAPGAVPSAPGATRWAEGGQDRELWPASLVPDRTIVEQAARKGGAHAIAEGLPDGYDTPVGHVLDGGRGLSGGEWQRVAVSRAFTRRPELLILDEPTAALDPLAEAELYQRFGELLEGRMALLISHRLGSARMADRILVLGDGRIVEEGHHDELVAARGAYARLWEEQAAWYR